ncbi:hypothetical protein [Bradyrhizobium sp.]
MSKPIPGGTYSKPVKLTEYSPPKGPKPVKPQDGGLSTKLPKK